jgi:hypothetical protein
MVHGSSYFIVVVHGDVVDMDSGGMLFDVLILVGGPSISALRVLHAYS